MFGGGKGPASSCRTLLSTPRGRHNGFQQFEDIQSCLIYPTRPAGKAEVYKLVEDDDTRWNSMDDYIERALYLQSALDEFFKNEIDN